MLSLWIQHALIFLVLHIFVRHDYCLRGTFEVVSFVKNDDGIFKVNIQSAADGGVDEIIVRHEYYVCGLRMFPERGHDPEKERERERERERLRTEERHEGGAGVRVH